MTEDTAGPDKVKQTDKVLLSSISQKYKLAKGYKHQVKLLISGGNTYVEGRDFEVTKTETGDSVISWILPPGIYLQSSGGKVFPTPSTAASYNWQDKGVYPNGDLETSDFVISEPGTNTVNVVTEGLEAKYSMSSAGMGPPWTRTEYANNIRFGYTLWLPGVRFYSPFILKATLRPAIRTSTLADAETGYGLFVGEGLIVYGTPCDFVGIGGYGDGVSDGCPTPAGTGGALTQTNSFEGEARIYANTSTIKVFRVKSTLGASINISGVANVGGNIRVTTAVNHGLIVGDVVFFEDNDTFVQTGARTILLFGYDGYRVSSVPSGTTFEVEFPDSTDWTFSSFSNNGTIKKVETCTAEYWDSGVLFPSNDIQFAIKKDENDRLYFFYNITGADRDWKRVGPGGGLDCPMGFKYSSSEFYYDKIILGAYTGGHTHLSGTIGTFNSSKSSDGTDYATVYRKLETECVGMSAFVPVPTFYNYIPVFDEEGSE